MIAWVVVGVGMLMLAFVFQTLAVRKRELDAGIAYAKAGLEVRPSSVPNSAAAAAAAAGTACPAR